MRKHIRTVSNLWKCSDHAHTRAKNRAVAEFQRLLSLSLSSLTNMRFLEDRMFALKTGQGRDNFIAEVYVRVTRSFHFPIDYM